MSKVVINDCFGGFSLSTEGIREYLRRTGRSWTEEETQFSRIVGPHFVVEGEPDWYDRDIPRDDPHLVAVVEEMGDRANGSCAHLVVEDVPAGTAYRIDEYDGNERIETRDAIDWSVSS